MCFNQVFVRLPTSSILNGQPEGALLSSYVLLTWGATTNSHHQEKPQVLNVSNIAVVCNVENLEGLISRRTLQDNIMRPYARVELFSLVVNDFDLMVSCL
ncbi:hypothetical protein EYZ11_007836 [Aspergillus tanneri]|uniref:Uncharacterized protein n=1 Tax=Aspergillus tanneri TaxID=1220188 RepID=A0A4S3JE84_9EURO|nr:hypothetical protein EYZ11_007836 [Aspergillus tanneri]